MTKELTVRNLYGIRGEITYRTDANVLVVTGDSGAGKSSFVKAFLHVFAHKSEKGAPDPTHEGQIEGAVTYTDEDLGLSFGRRFKNGKMSSVEIRALDGARYADNPAVMLKSRIGTVTVDVSEFLAVDESKRRELIMAKSVFPDGFDLDALTAQQAKVELARTEANREKTRLEGALSQMVPPSKSTPDTEVSAAEIYAEIEAAQAHNQKLTDAARNAQSVQQRINDLEREIERLLAEVAAHRAKQVELELQRGEALPDGEPIDLEPLMARLSAVEVTNRDVRARATFLGVKADLEAAAAKHKELDEKLQGIKKAKFDGLASAVLPHASLSVDEEFVRWDGVAFSSVNSAARALAAVAVAISGEHADDELKLVILKDGDWLDPKSLAAVDELITAEGFFALIDRGRPDMPADMVGIDVIELADGQVSA